MPAPVRAIQNQYRGVNAHLHSFWQATNTWHRFHNGYVTHLMQSLQARLIPLGYIVEIEESLQVRRLWGDAPRQPRPDLLIYDAQSPRLTAPIASPQGLSVADLLLEDEDSEHPYSALAIYPLSASSDDSTYGDPIAWLEVLSPSNKGTSRDAEAYLGKRRALLSAGITLIELDYLHETPPTVRTADYSRPESRANAHPYRIVVLDPRPDIRQGPAGLYEFDTDAPIPNVQVRLAGVDTVGLDFDAPYRQMFAQGYYGYKLDYAALPLNFERYSAADQARIARRMLTVLRAAAQSDDLDAAPLPLTDATLDLDAALAQITHYKDTP
ncbi:MAG: DUF4058 family protein [Armatimonadetes bacterium]|nr:DUF4058 family protein [Anaerolineae bacterium]